MVSGPLEAFTGRVSLPIWITVAETYGHLWRHRWTYFLQIFIWALLVWAMQIPALFLSALIRFAGLDWTVSGRDLAPYVVNMTTLIVCLLAGGGLMFLSCGRAVMYGRQPRIGDAVRPLRMGSFWRILMIYWLVVNLVPTVAVHSARIYFEIAQIDNPWLLYYALVAVYWAWAVPAAQAIVVALPIAAFEAHGRPIREGWLRLRGNRARMVALCILAALPPLAAVMLTDYGTERLVTYSYENDWPYVVEFFLAWPLLAPFRTMLSLLLILILGASVVCAYARLSPRFDDVARVFD